MTCVAFLVDDNQSTIHAAYDSEVSDADSGQTLSMLTPKVAINGKYLIGACSSVRVINVLHHCTLPEPSGNLDRFMATTFAAAMADALERSPGGSTAEKIDEDTDIIVGVHGRLFVFGDDYSCFEPASDYTAVGSGYGAAMGSLFTSEDFDITSQRRVTLAVEAAAYSSIGVREPVGYVRL